MLRLRRGCLQRLSRELKFLRGNVRLTANSLPFVGEIHSFGGYHSEQRSFRGEDGNNVCSAFELSVHAFHDVGGSETSLYLGRAINDGKAFFDVFFDPIGQLVWLICPQNRSGMLNHQLGRCSVPGVEYISNRRSRDTAVSHARHMSLCILLEMEWTALPGDSGKCFGKGLTNPLVIIAGDAVRPVHSSHHEALNEGSPVLSRFGKSDGNTRHHTPTCFRLNTNGNQYSTITDAFIPSHLGISGIKEKRGYRRNRAISPFLKRVSS